MAHPLYVAFYWHMHQPLYRDTLTGRYQLPWVRLHATKDYLHMGEVLRRYPRVHQTFNFVPSLVEQLDDYGERGATDRWLEVSLKEDLSDDDKRFMLANFFSINWDRVVRQYPAYQRLLELRNEVGTQIELLAEPYWRALAVWFNLAWIDPTLVEADDDLQKLRDKGRDYTLADARLLAEKHYGIIRRVIPYYRDLQDAGQVELTTSPYYHPILPLLVDVGAARVASPSLPLPDANVRWPEDAAEQLRRARESHEDHFGRAPQGLWPSEGSVSPATVDLLNGRDRFQWLASDEAILARSLGIWFERDGGGQVFEPRRLYQPYLTPDGRTTIIFRDRVLSDRIGFVYQHMDGREAAADLIGRLHTIRDRLLDAERPYLVPIVLDGENCWEFYAANGNVFLNALYERLEADRGLQAVSVGEYLDRFPARERLTYLFSGSWINQNLETWVGESDQNRAWELLAHARSRLIAWQNENVLADFETLARAWEQIYIAEGSDWFWWYYSRNRIEQAPQFDEEFRNHLTDVYGIIGQPAPAWLREPIGTAVQSSRQRPVVSAITPSLTAIGEVGPEWSGAGYVEPAASTGAMQMGSTLLRRLYFGHGDGALFLRLEGNDDLARYRLDFYFATPNQGPANVQVRAQTSTNEAPGLPLGWEVSLLPGSREAVLSQAMGGDRWQLRRRIGEVALGPRVAELRLPLVDLGLEAGDEVHLVATLARDDVLVEVLPRMGQVTFALT